MKYGTGEDEPSQHGPSDQPAPMDSAGQQRPKAPGAGLLATMMQEGGLVATPSQERIFHAKATRTIGFKYNVGPWELEYIGALDIYLHIVGKQGIGIQQARFIDWTGARKNWKHRMKEAQERAEREGLIEFIPVQSGRVIDITEKGRRCLEDYCKRFEEVKEDTRQRIIRGAIEREGKDLKRRRKQAA